MPAPEKVSAQQITNALLKWRGDVKAAADDLGLSRNGLYGRISALRLNLSGFRKVGTVVPSNAAVSTMPAEGSHRGRANHAGNRPVPTFQAAASGRIVGAMNGGALAVVETIRRRTTPRLRPDHLDRLTEAKYDLQAILRRDVSETEILGECLEACLEAWLRQKMESVKPKARSGK